MLTYKRIAVVGSSPNAKKKNKGFTNYLQMKSVLDEIVEDEDWIVSGGALGADSMAQRYAKETGRPILIFYPLWRPNGILDRGAGYKRNKLIVEHADLVLAFYEKGRYQQGGTANTAVWARTLDVELREYEEQ